MPNACISPEIYQSQLKQQNTSSTTSIVLISIFLPLQFILMTIIFIQGYRKYKSLIIKQKNQQYDKQIKQSKQSLKRLNQQDNANMNSRNKVQQKNAPKNQPIQENILYKFLFSQPFIIKISLLSILFSLISALCIILLLLSVLSVYQAVDKNYSDAQCNLINKVTEYQTGSQNWVGIQNLIPNITELNLILNTRIQVSINAIRGLVLNGTVAAIKPGLGFANNTFIRIIISQSPFSATNLSYNTIKGNINASVRYWLFMNSSLSAGTFFPVCQNSNVFPIQHPLITGQTVQLDYMSGICSKLTNQVDQLVQNGDYVDQLLVKLESVKSSKSNIQTNLSSLSSIYSPIASRTQQYNLQLSSFGFDFKFAYYLPLITLAGVSLITLVIILYFLFAFCFSCCSCCTCKCQCDDDQQSEEWQIRQIKKINNSKKYYFEISYYFPRFILLFLISINVLIGISSYLYSNSSVQLKQTCQNFRKSQADATFFNSLGLSQSQKQLLTPIQQCTSGKNQYFMQNIPLVTSRSSLEQLIQISQTYNASVPKNVLQSQSLKQIEVLKQYLFHLQTMPIKSTQFNLIQLLDQINKLSNGSDINSKQIAECSKSVIQDEYVYNSIDCKHKVMDLVNQLSVTQPRCIIIPTYDGTPGTTTTHLNEAQHNFILNVTCPTVNHMFSPGNVSCFIAKRLALLTAQNCINTASQMGTRLQNLVKFSQQASAFTDIYMQNVRNLFGLYLTSSSNLTQFFAGTNMSQTLGAFGYLSNNLLNRTKCSDINSKVNEIYNTYCPSQNTISMLFADGYVWTIVTVVAIFIQSIVFYVLDLLLRVYRMRKFFGKIARKSNKRRIQPINDKNNQIQVSQQTLVRNNIFDNQEQTNEVQISQNFQQIDQMVDQPNQRKRAQYNQKQFQHINSKQRIQNVGLGNQKSFQNTNTEMIFDRVNSSPVKSKNPYGNYSDSIIQYPHLGSSQKKIIAHQFLKEQDQSLKNQNYFEYQKPSTNHPQLILNKKTENKLNPIFDEFDSAQESEQNPNARTKFITKKQTFKLVENPQDVSNTNNVSSIKRLTKINLQQTSKEIKPALIYNLQDYVLNEDKQKNQDNLLTQGELRDPELIKREQFKLQIRTPRYKIDSQSQDNQVSPKQIKTNRNVSRLQKGLGNDTGRSIPKSKNYLEISLNKDQLFNQNQLEVVQLKNKKRRIQKSNSPENVRNDKKKESQRKQESKIKTSR